MELLLDGRVLAPIYHNQRNSAPSVFLKHFSLLPKCRTGRELRNLLSPMIVLGLFLDTWAVKKVITIFSTTGLVGLEYAELMLKQADDPCTFTCNAVIRGYEQSSQPFRALSIYNWMLLTGLSPDKFTFPFLFKVCATARALVEGEKIHCRIFKSPTSLDLFVQASILAMYAKCGEIEMARLLFDFMPHKSLVCWNTIIDGYAKYGDMDAAVKLFNQMPEHDLFSWNVMIDGHAKCGQIEKAKYLFDKMLERDAVTWNTIIDGYAKSRNMKSARELFDMAPFKDVVTWGIIINGYVINGQIGLAHNLFEKTPYKSTVTWNCLINGYAKFNDVNAACKLFELIPFRNLNSWNVMLDALAKCGKMVLASHVYHTMPNKDIFSLNILIDGHAKLGEMRKARELFDTMPHKDVVSWNIMLGGYKQKQQWKDLFELFFQMQILEKDPDFSTLAVLLSVISDLGLISHGRQLHAYLTRNNFSLDSIIGVALIDMYSKCGFVERAFCVFDMISKKSIDHWNVMISAFASHGCGKLAIAMFVDMEFSMTRPDDVTFIAILNACSHAGLVYKGYEYLRLMRQKYGITPNVQHYGCMVDLLSRAGHIMEAVQLVHDMPMRANDVIWRALLGASRTHCNIEVAEFAARHLIELVPDDSSSYVLLANIYGYKGQSRSAQNVWETMSERGVVKNTACSFIELQGQLNEFTAGYTSHPQIMEIVFSLNYMNEGLASDLSKYSVTLDNY